MAANKSAESLGSLQTMVDAALREMALTQVVARLWAKDHSLWKPEPTEITNRLGWLAVPEKMQDRVGQLRVFAESIRKAGFRHVVLLGMGGSSLGPEVLRSTFGSAKGYPRLWVLDSTIPGWVRQVSQSILPARTLFIVASKSGSTVEAQSLFSYFWNLVTRTQGNTGGSQFVAITDPGTSLVSLAQDRGFRTIFLNPPDIGGRYSVLSYFGLIPAALLGLDLKRLVGRSAEMARSCGPSIPSHRNPGAHLGAVLGTLGRAGHDKITLLVSPQVKSFGLWVEQLLAESTGKEGQGLVPIAEEPLVPPEAYGHDRLFIYLRLAGDANGRLDQQVKWIEQAGQPVLRRTLRDRYDLAAEFFCWEFATAVAGHFLGINPFDQPNVQESKENTARILKELDENGHSLQSLKRTLKRTKKQEVELADLLAKASPGRYFAILAYVTPSTKFDAAVAALRKAVSGKCHIATTAGYGPRYLHSTGQLHKGGPNTGLFLQLVEHMTPDVKVPEAPYTFGALAEAQAIGDLQSLEAHHRSVGCIRFGRDALSIIKALVRLVEGCPEPRPRSTAE